jgi:hypothetical protein
MKRKGILGSIDWCSSNLTEFSSEAFKENYWNGQKY